MVLLFQFMCSLLKSEQKKKRRVYICVIYNSRSVSISVLFEAPRITVCVVYIAATHHIDHGTSM